MEVDNLRGRLKAHHQEHLLKYWDDPDLKGKDQQQLYDDLMDIDFGEMNSIFERSTGKRIGSLLNMTNGVSENGATNGQEHVHSENDNEIPIDEKMEPMEDELCASIKNSCEHELDNFRNISLDHIAEGHIGVLLLAGGQGTRLGVSYPKGNKLIFF